MTLSEHLEKVKLLINKPDKWIKDISEISDIDEFIIENFTYPNDKYSLSMAIDKRTKRRF